MPAEWGCQSGSPGADNPAGITGVTLGREGRESRVRPDGVRGSKAEAGCRSKPLAIWIRGGGAWGCWATRPE